MSWVPKPATAGLNVLPDTPHPLYVPLEGVPNDKQARTTTGGTALYYLGTDADINYTVRFQNTVNAAAQNVFIIDTLSSIHDLTSLEVLGASHPFTAQYGLDRTLRFDFENINLPDSTNDEPNSHGFVTFRLRPTGSMMVGDVISNTAGIYFDLNPAVITNTTALLVESSTFVSAVASEVQFNVWPIPTTDQVRFGSGGNPVVLIDPKVWSMDGRSVISKRGSHGALDVTELENGAYILQGTLKSGTVVNVRFVKE